MRKNIAGGRAAPIGVFDSGIGGLTVLKEIMSALPGEGTIYLGDTARVPYGIRSKETVVRYSFEGMRFLLGKGIKLLVVACNTMSATSLDAIKKKSPVPVIGVIEPGARAALRNTRNKRIGVIGTEATIKSRAYEKAIGRKAHVFGLACPLFVPLVEEGSIEGDIAELAAQKYLSPLKDKDIDTLLLGCTHYPLLKKTLSKVMGKGVTLIDSAKETAKETKTLLKRRGIQSGSAGGRATIYAGGRATFFVTDSPERFKAVGEKFLGRKLRNIKLVRLEMEV